GAIVERVLDDGVRGRSFGHRHRDRIRDQLADDGLRAGVVLGAVEQLEVLAKALFIPTFFLATGFLIDIPLLGRTIVSKPDLAFGLIAVLALGKLIAAVLIKLIYTYSGNEAKLIFSITLPQMAATLASAVVGYQTVNAQNERMLDTEIVNAVLVLVVVTCV